MSLTGDHITERELALAANRELSPARFAAVVRHVESCSECRTRLSSYETALGEYFHARREDLDPHVPDPAAARQRLSQRIEKLAASRSAWLWPERGPRFGPLRAAIAAAAVAACLAGIAFLRQTGAEPARFAPDSALTPGLTRPVTAAELCAHDMDEPAPRISRAVALEVFRRHGIANPAAGAYELDYLIPPELGGARDDRNLWPQPYEAEPWNAYAKDALEDELRRLVCSGKVDLRVAQEEIANDWTLAYRKYFETGEPLLSHAAFLKDVPWQ
jgi:hypothetical protein